MGRLGFPTVPSGKRARQQRQQAATPKPPPVGKGGGISRRTLVIAGVVLFVLVGLGVGLGIGLSGGGKSSAPAVPIVDFSKIPGLQTGPPPWNNGSANLSDKLQFVHLDALTSEGTVLHIHQHLDVFVNGKHVAVPAGIGIDDNTFLTEIHTHDSSGIVHVESPVQQTFGLGQLFGEWGVKLTSNCLGRYCGDLHWWVNGTEQTGNPADLALSSHQEIVIAIGKPPAHVPTSYHFPAGL
jgi:hypothetical protein